MQDSCIKSIMVQLADPAWTSNALHLACTLARANSCDLTIVKLIPVGHPGWLGTELGYRNFTTADQDLLQEYSATAEDYGVRCSVDLYQYLILSDAILDAAEYFDAHLTFATLPRYRLPLWRRFLMWHVHRQFDGHRRLLKTLEEPGALNESMLSPAVSSFISAEEVS